MLRLRSASSLLLTYVRSAARCSDNSDGVRVAQSVDGTETRWVQTLASHCTSYNGLSNAGCGLPQVLVEYTSGGTTLYSYGLGRLAQENGNDAEWFLGDALGSVRQVVDDNGDVLLARDYTPYGQELSESGTGSSGYGSRGNSLRVTRNSFISALAGWTQLLEGSLAEILGLVVYISRARYTSTSTS